MVNEEYGVVLKHLPRVYLVFYFLLMFFFISLFPFCSQKQNSLQASLFSKGQTKKQSILSDG